jgi:hypothetical protein
MEVHAHTHTPRKKWTHYLWEFLMLFLAVFCGFLAEYQLEHIIEKQKAKQYMVSLYDDLKIDNEQLQLLIPEFSRKNLRLDTMLQLIKGVSETTGANGLYNYYYEAGRYPDFIYTDRTIQQLKNSGGLRLITNKNVSDSIIAYDGSVRMMEIHIREGIDYQLHTVREANTKLFDLRCPQVGNEVSYDTISFPYPGKLLSYEEKTIVEYYNNVQEMKRIFNTQKTNLEILLAQNKRLRSLLEKEYHLE